MRSPRPHRPSPALVIACIALFTSLGGTGYAATQLHFGATSAKAKSKRKPAPKYITSSQANKLIAAYIASHHITGPAGPQGLPGAKGANGGEGKTGPQGPGAKAIVLKGSSASSSTETASFGPWTLSNFCGTAEDSWGVEGPGNFSDTIVRGKVGATASAENENGEIASTRLEESVLSGFQSNVHMFVSSGSTVEELDIEVTAVHAGLFETCEVVGTATPAS
jgi:hypothetical protein